MPWSWKSLAFLAYFLGFPGGSVVKNPPADPALIPESGRSPGGGHGNPLQYSCLENPMDSGAWQEQSIVSQRVGHNWSNWACLFPRVMLFFPYQRNTSYLVATVYNVWVCVLSLFHLQTVMVQYSISQAIVLLAEFKLLKAN